MGKLIAVASILLALVAAGSIIYIARELTSKDNLPDGPDEPARDERDRF